MDPIIVELPNGQKAEFPAGTPPEVIERVKAQYGGPARPPALPQSSPRVGAPPGGAGSIADSFLARAGRGALINRVDPGAEILARISDATGATPYVNRVSDALGLPKSDAKTVQGLNAGRVADQAASRARAGSEGFDWAALTGTAAADMATLGGIFRAAGRPEFVKPQNLADVSKAGAAAGAIVGPAGPVEKSERMSGPELAWAKAKQAALGGAFGAVAAPLVSVGIDKLVSAGQSLGAGVRDTIRRTVAPSEGQRTASDPKALEDYLVQQAQSTGVDWARLPDTIKESLREATRRATVTTGELPQHAIRNRLVAEAEGLPQLTLGQATRDPVQFSREMNSPDEGLRAFLGSQRDTATQRLREVGEGIGPKRTPYELGSEIETTIAAQSEARRKAINALYESARSNKGGYQIVQNTTDFAKAAVRDLKTEQLWDELPSGIKTQLRVLLNEDGRYKLTARQAAKMLQNINGLATDARDPANVALAVVKRNLNALLDAPQFRDPVAGGAVVDAFRRAGAERASMGKWEDSSAAIAELAKRNPRVATERIFDRYIMSGSVDDFSGLWKTIPAEIQQGIKRQFVDTVASAAMNKTQSQAAGAAGAASELLRKFPKEKLDLMFKPAELKSLRNTLEYLRLTSEAPAGNFVNRSNSLVDLKDFLSQSQNIPIAGPNIMAPLRRMMEESAAREATSGRGLAVPARDLVVPDAIRHIEQLTPRIVAPRGRDVVEAGVNAFRGPPEE